MGIGLVYGCLRVTPPIAGKDRLEVQECLELLDQAFGGRSLPTERVVCDEAAREQLIRAHGAEQLGFMVFNPAHYGEISPLAFCQLLHGVGVRPRQRFYDLGSGNGKLVMLAWLLGLDAVGIEIVAERAHEASAKLELLREIVGDAREDGSMAGISLIHGSCLGLDFSDADIVFTYDLLFSKEMKEDIGRTSQKMGKGSCVVSSRGLPGDGLTSPTHIWTWDPRKECAPQQFAVQMVLGPGDVESSE